MEEMRDKLLEMFPGFHVSAQTKSALILTSRKAWILIERVCYSDMFCEVTNLYRVMMTVPSESHPKSEDILTPLYDEARFWDFDYIVGFIKENLPKLSDNSDKCVQNSLKSHENAPECVS